MIALLPVLLTSLASLLRVSMAQSKGRDGSCNFRREVRAFVIVIG